MRDHSLWCRVCDGFDAKTFPAWNAEKCPHCGRSVAASEKMNHPARIERDSTRGSDCGNVSNMIELNSTSNTQSAMSMPQRRADVAYAYHFASEYVERGWSVIPVVGKRPAIAWKEFQQRLATRNQIGTWFGEKNPNQFGVGIVTGALSGLVGVDCDTNDATDFWLNNFPVSPLIVETGGGGIHVYYRLSEGGVPRNRTGLFGMPIDFRGEGGYLVAPPSRHSSGQAYRWTNWDEYCLDDVPQFDSAWIEAGTGKRSGARVSRGPVSDPVAYIRRIVARSGERGHDATYRAACVLRDAGLTEAEALAKLVDWNFSNAIPPWSTDELLHKVTSAFIERPPK